RSESRLWTVGPGGSAAAARTRLDLQCVADQSAVRATVCGAFDGTKTRVFLVEPHVDRPRPLGWLPGRFYMHGSTAAGWVTGWWNSRAVMLRLSTREVLSLADPAAARVRTVAIAAHVVGALIPGEPHVVRLYERP
ncbi:MAG TPA: hypothetical protein VKD69_00675, partial [Vicinamibacterales bacterium]|nr:hypothetical protein [Vicinamibacterales bacterium]